MQKPLTLADFANPRGLLGLTPNLLSTPPGPALGLARFALSATPALAIPDPPPQWIYVRRRFTQFFDNLELTSAQLSDGNTKQAGIRDCLNKHYYDLSSETANSILIGSWGKYTRVRPPRDIDILFILPNSVYWKYDGRAGNKQSQLLQEVKSVLDKKYTRTDMNGDRHVVVVPFATMPVELAVGFRATDGNIIVCDTKAGGSYITSTAEIESSNLNVYDAMYGGNVRALIKMMKCWQTEKNVPLKSFLLEILAIEFIAGWVNNTRDVYWYDWMVRDFFAYLCTRANGYISMPGSGELIALGNDWLFKSQTAYKNALNACEFEISNSEYVAGSYWQDIFGNTIPMGVS